MSGPAPDQDASGEPAAPAARLRLIRVKRKRGAEAPEDLVVKGFNAPGKRANTSLSSAIAGLGLEHSAAPAAAGTIAAEQSAGEADANNSAVAPARRVQRYRKLSTLSVAQLRGMDQQQLHSLLASSQQQGAQQWARQRVGVKGGALVAATEPIADRAVQCLQAGQAARYEHIRRRRGLSAFSITEQSADPLEQLASVYDVVRHEQPEGGAQAGVDKASAQEAAGEHDTAGAASQQQRWRQEQQQEQRSLPSRRLTQAQRAAVQYDEGTLMCNCLPMIREYLQAEGRGLGDPQQQQQQEQEQVGTQEKAACMEEEGGSDSEYVYDLYAAVEIEEDEEEGRAQEEDWWELHASGRAPVVQILDDDSWVVLEQSDAEDSDAATEDSNAEGYYAHDYPEEASDLDSSDDDGYDPEGSMFGGKRRQQQQQRSWDSESYGSDEE